MYVFKLLVNHFSVTNKTKSSFSKPKEMISHCCLDAKTSLRRFFRSTCDFFSQKSSSLKEKCAFLNKSKTTQNRSESLRKWFLTAASTQRHPWEEFFGQHVIFWRKSGFSKEKCVFLNKRKTKQIRSESLRKWFLTVASTQRHLCEDLSMSTLSKA